MSNAAVEFTFSCPHCGQHISAATADAEIQAQCPVCSQAFIVPLPPPRARPVAFIAATARQTLSPSKRWFLIYGSIGATLVVGIGIFLLSRERSTPPAVASTFQPVSAQEIALRSGYLQATDEARYQMAEMAKSIELALAKPGDPEIKVSFSGDSKSCDIGILTSPDWTFPQPGYQGSRSQMWLGGAVLIAAMAVKDSPLKIDYLKIVTPSRLNPKVAKVHLITTVDAGSIATRRLAGDLSAKEAYDLILNRFQHFSTAP
jgi:hypothetical protein